MLGILNKDEIEIIKSIEDVSIYDSEGYPLSIYVAQEHPGCDPYNPQSAAERYLYSAIPDEIAIKLRFVGFDESIHSFVFEETDEWINEVED